MSSQALEATVKSYLMGNISFALARLDELENETLAVSDPKMFDVDLDIMWIILCGCLVVFMQAGFSLLEAGSVSEKNITNILFKNISDACISSMCFWLVGYAISFGKTAGGILGTSNFALTEFKNYSGAGGVGNDGWAKWFFQWAFAGTSCTIVSGCMAERTQFEAYLVFSAVMSSVIYPVVVHWVWGEGFLSAWGAYPDDQGNPRPLLTGTTQSNGMLDFAGSGVVHMVGGYCGLIGAILVGPRTFRFDDTGQPNEPPAANPMLLCLGTLILWCGWYAFNCGSTLSLAGNAANVAGKVGVNVTIAGATGCILSTLLARAFDKYFNICVSVNGVLAGLVAITASCAFVDPWMSFMIGAVGSVVFLSARSALLRLGIDDPLDAFPVHGACGLWGVISAGIFCTDANVQFAGYPNVNDACASGEQFGVQIIGASAILLWVTVCAGAAFMTLKKTIGIRVSARVEEAGLDHFEHGGIIIALQEESKEEDYDRRDHVSKNPTTAQPVSRSEARVEHLTPKGAQRFGTLQHNFTVA